MFKLIKRLLIISRIINNNSKRPFESPKMVSKDKIVLLSQVSRENM